MNKTKRFLGYSIFLTILYVIWLLPGYWNLGFAIINGLFLGIVLGEYKRIKNSNFLKIIWGISLVLGLFMAIRSYDFVRFLTFVSIFILDFLLVILAKQPRAKIDIGRLVKSSFGFVNAMFVSVVEVFVVIFKLRNNVDDTLHKKVLVGVLMSIPLLFIFGALFYGADPIFAKVVNQIKLPNIKIDEKLLGNVVSTILFFGVIGGLFKNKLVAQIKNTKWMQSFTELNVATSLLNILFVVFSFIQIKYFLATPDDLKKLQIVFSDYTRLGYGQTITASLLAYLVVLKLELSLRSQIKLNQKASKLTSFLTWSMLVQILIFIIAATKRNYIYQSFYGFTEIRLLGFALSIWLVLMLGLLAYKIWQKRKMDFFTRGIILITVVSILGLNIFDIDGTIVRTKPARMDWGTDYNYLSYLSDDAWMGWEKILKNSEEKIANSSFSGLSEVVMEKDLINRLKARRHWNVNRDKNHWNWGGSFNYSAMMSKKYWDKNGDRVEKILNNLTEMQSRLAKKQDDEEKLRKLKAQEELFLNCKNNLYNRLNEYYKGKVSIAGESVLLKTGLEMGPSEQTLMFNRVEEATGGIKYRWFWTDSNANKTFVRIYAISCVRY